MLFHSVVQVHPKLTGTSVRNRYSSEKGKVTQRGFSFSVSIFFQLQSVCFPFLLATFTSMLGLF